MKQMFFWNSLAFSMIQYVGNLISGCSAFSKSSLNIWKFSVHKLLKPGLENFEHYFASVWDECNCAIVWTLFGTTFLWDWNENWPFPVLWPLQSFPNLLVYWVQHFKSIQSQSQNIYFELMTIFVYLGQNSLSLRMEWKWRNFKKRKRRNKEPQRCEL